MEEEDNKDASYETYRQIDIEALPEMVSVSVYKHVRDTTHPAPRQAIGESTTHLRAISTIQHWT